MSEIERFRQAGRIGGLSAWARNDVDTMIGPARRAFRARFDRIVDPDGLLDPAERAIRSDRERRAYMLKLAAKSAAVRRKKAERGGLESRVRPVEDTGNGGIPREES